MADSPRSDDELDAWIVATIQRALAYALSLLGNRTEAEDVVHDCYSRLLARAANYDLPREGTPLLFKAITHACINQTQRRRRHVTWQSAEQGSDAGVLAEPAALQPPQQAMQHELAAAIDAGLAELSPPQRAAVELRSMGYSLLEIAEMLEVSYVNARALLHRGRTRLAVRLQPFLQEHVK